MSERPKWTSTVQVDISQPLTFPFFNINMEIMWKSVSIKHLLDSLRTEFIRVKTEVRTCEWSINKAFRRTVRTQWDEPCFFIFTQTFGMEFSVAILAEIDLYKIINNKPFCGCFACDIRYFKETMWNLNWKSTYKICSDIGNERNTEIL